MDMDYIEELDPLDDPIFGKSSSHTQRLEADRKSTRAEVLNTSREIYMAGVQEAFEAFQDRQSA